MSCAARQPQNQLAALKEETLHGPGWGRMPAVAGRRFNAGALPVFEM